MHLARALIASLLMSLFISKQFINKTSHVMSFEETIKYIKQFTPHSLFERCFSFIKTFENRDKGAIAEIPFWDVLTLMKWIMIYGEDGLGIKIATIKDIKLLLSQIDLLKGKHYYAPGNNKEFNLTKFLAIMSYHQTYFQHTIHMDSFSRQLFLFYKIKSKHDIEKVFIENTNLNVKEFLLFSFILYVYTNREIVSNDPPYYDGNLHQDFLEICNAVIPNKINYFLSLLSINSVIDSLKQQNKINKGELNVYEIPVFAKYPIIKINNHFCLLHKRLLNYTTNYFIYDYLKKIDNEKFAEEFGRRFEKYIELGLKEINSSYITENELKNKLGKNHNVVDFIVDDSILIECKAIEQKPYPSVFPDEKVLQNWLEDSIIKAYSKQMLTVANKINSTKECFGVIVTYKETYFGTGPDAWSNFLAKPTKTFANKNNLDIDVLPPENLFFIDVYAWDKMMVIVKDGQASIREILEKARSANTNFATKKFQFFMHLNDYKPGSMNLDYIADAYNEITNDIERIKNL